MDISAIVQRRMHKICYQRHIRIKHSFVPHAYCVFPSMSASAGAVGSRGTKRKKSSGSREELLHSTSNGAKMVKSVDETPIAVVNALPAKPLAACIMHNAKSVEQYDKLHAKACNFAAPYPASIQNTHQQSEQSCLYPFGAYTCRQH